MCGMRKRVTLRIARKRKKLSKTELARLTGLDRNTIARLEAGINQPNYSTWMALEDALETPLCFPLRKAARRG